MHYNDSNTCVCCGRDIPEGVQVCKVCERNASTPVKRIDMSKAIAAIRIGITAILLVLVVLSIIYN